MTVRLTADGIIELDGLCPSEDAEPLQQLLLAHPEGRVDWRGCDSLHTAVVQVLLAAQPTLLGPPRGRFLVHYVEPALSLLSS